MSRIVITLLLLVAGAFAQESPIIAGFKKQMAERSGHLVAAAQAMPADKYSFKASEKQMTFGHLVFHTARSNYFLCSALVGEKPPSMGELKDTDPKDPLVNALAGSFKYCDSISGKIDVSKLGEEVKLPWTTMTKAELLLELNADWADHYSLAATYLRLNGLLPPTAKK